MRRAAQTCLSSGVWPDGSRRGADEQGQSLVEFGVALPVFLLLLWLLADFGRAVYMSNALATVVRDGARVATVAPRDCARIAQTIQDRAVLIDLSAAGAITVTTPDGVEVGKPVTVRVEARYAPLTPAVGALLGDDGLVITAKSTLTIQQVAATLVTPCP